MEPGETPGPLVTDTTVFVNFARVRRLDLLGHLSRTLWCPEVVWQQTIEQRLGDYDVQKEMQTLCSSGDLTRKRVDEPEQLQLMNRFLKRLDEGEADVLALAVTRDCPVATDDRLARELAAQHDVRCTGTIGILFSFVASGVLTLGRGADLHEAMRERGYFSPFESREAFIATFRSRAES